MSESAGQESDNWAAVLREPFPAAMIGKLPRITCKACAAATTRVCSQHSKKRCPECGNTITTAHIHLDYVGHAATTDRLLKADPAWTWRLLAANPDGSPVVFSSGLADPAAKLGIWIELEVCGVRTPGFGEGKNFKEAISDAVRNAAMRRGVALDLWAKEDLHAEEGEPSAEAESGPKLASQPQRKKMRALQAKLHKAEAISDETAAKLDKAAGDPQLTAVKAGELIDALLAKEQALYAVEP